MGADVKGRGEGRGYDASGRRESARRRRRAVVAAAQALVEERGFAATTVAEVARRSGVSPESVYKSFGSKAALVKEAFDVAVAGDDEKVPVAERPENQRIRSEPDVRVKLRLYVEGVVVRAGRTARLQLALRDAAAGNPEIDALWQTLQVERLRGMAMLAGHLVESGGLAAGVEVDEVRDVLWAGISVEVYDLLVLQRGWTPEAYGRWLERMLVATLVDR